MNVLMRGLSGLIFLLFSLSFAITITIFVSPLVYNLVIQWFNLEQLSGLTSEELMINYQVIMNYLINPKVDQLQMPFFSMSEGGRIHFEETKVLFFINFVITGVLLAVVIYMVYKIRTNNLQLYMQTSFYINLAFPLILLFFIFVAFDQLFILFHRFLFNNELWLFNPLTDPVITVLPQNLFMILFILALLIYELIVLVMRMVVNWRNL
ncbi:TIGR01906 family membrane protein [Aerococcaceae bacterium WGS1372]